MCYSVESVEWKKNQYWWFNWYNLVVVNGCIWNGFLKCRFSGLILGIGEENELESSSDSPYRYKSGKFKDLLNIISLEIQGDHA